MPAPKGRPRPAGSGRKKGSSNKLTADVKTMILGALHAKGGQKYLESQADANPVAFMTLVGKVLPLTLAGDKENPVEVIQTITRRIIKDGEGD